MPVYNATHKFIYLFEPHTASRATLQWLMDNVKDSSNISHHHMGIQEMTNWRRQRLRQTDVLKCNVICTVRNPLDTFITRWRFGPYKDATLDKFVESHPNHQSILNPGMGLYREAEYFCFYERLQEDLQWMFNRPNAELPLNESHVTPKKKPWWTYYEGKPELVDKLTNLYKDYLRKFGYVIQYQDNRPFLSMSPKIQSQLCQQIL